MNELKKVGVFLHKFRSLFFFLMDKIFPFLPPSTRFQYVYFIRDEIMNDKTTTAQKNPTKLGRLDRKKDARAARLMALNLVSKSQRYII